MLANQRYSTAWSDRVELSSATNRELRVIAYTVRRSGVLALSA
jgi:hypothetical protein